MSWFIKDNKRTVVFDDKFNESVIEDVKKDLITKALHNSAYDSVTVTFTKKNGDVRDMKCTLREEKIPAEHVPSSANGTYDKDTVRRVFDLDKQAWRSFRWDSVIKFDCEFAKD